MMNVLVVEPGTLPYEKEINGLQEMQELVGGLIDAIYPYDDPVALVCNDEGLLLGLPFNRSVEGGYGGICGTCCCASSFGGARWRSVWASTLGWTGRLNAQLNAPKLWP